MITLGPINLVFWGERISVSVSSQKLILFSALHHQLPCWDHNSDHQSRLNKLRLSTPEIFIPRGPCVFVNSRCLPWNPKWIIFPSKNVAWPSRHGGDDIMAAWLSSNTSWLSALGRLRAAMAVECESSRCECWSFLQNRNDVHHPAYWNHAVLPLAMDLQLKVCK